MTTLRAVIEPTTLTAKLAIATTSDGGGVQLASTTPAALGSATVGVGTTAARADHVHAMPDAADVGATTAAAVAAAYQPLDADLTALAALSTSGLVARTGSGTVATRTITAPAAGITVANGDGVSGAPTLALANDLAAVEGLSTTGIVRRTGSDAWSAGTLVTLAEMADLATATMIGRTTAGTGVPEALTLAQIREMLGIPEAVLSGSWSESAGGSLVDITGLTFTPAANARYLVEVRGTFTAAASTTGFQWAIMPGNATGGGYLVARGSSSGAQVVAIGAIDGTSPCNGTSSAASIGDEAGFWGWAILQSHATSPTAVTVAARTETGGSAISVGANRARLTYLRLA